MARLVIDLDRSIEVLAEMGFLPLPSRINGKGELRETLDATHSARQRLSLEQLDLYNTLIQR